VGRRRNGGKGRRVSGGGKGGGLRVGEGLGVGEKGMVKVRGGENEGGLRLETRRRGRVEKVEGLRLGKGEGVG
jgi:hypothetical protein